MKKLFNDFKFGLVTIGAAILVVLVSIGLFFVFLLNDAIMFLFHRKKYNAMKKQRIIETRSRLDAIYN